MSGQSKDKRQKAKDFDILGRLIETTSAEPDPRKEKAGPTSPALWFLGNAASDNLALSNPADPPGPTIQPRYDWELGTEN
jgi:hypothetical protein